MPIPKAGNLNEVDNYRGNAQYTFSLKVTNKMILNRIQLFINHLLRNNQKGFRPGRSTTTHMLALRRFIALTEVVCSRFSLLMSHIIKQ